MIAHFWPSFSDDIAKGGVEVKCYRSNESEDKAEWLEKKLRARQKSNRYDKQNCTSDANEVEMLMRE